MKIDYILSSLRLKGIDCYSSWLGKQGGAYLIARIGRTDDALVSLIPINDAEDNKFIDFIVKKITPHQRLIDEG